MKGGGCLMYKREGREGCSVERKMKSLRCHGLHVPAILDTKKSPTPSQEK